MAWDWFGTAATGAVGMVGTYFTWRSSKEGREHAERLTGVQLEHERQMATEARHQQRIEDAYIRLLGMVETAGVWAQSVKPMMDTIPPRPDPDLPPIEMQTEVQAIIGAFGSDEATALFDAWVNVLLQMISAVGLINLEDDARYRGEREVDFGTPRLTLHELRPQESAARKALARQVGVELRG